MVRSLWGYEKVPLGRGCWSTLGEGTQERSRCPHGMQEQGRRPGFAGVGRGWGEEGFRVWERLWGVGVLREVGGRGGVVQGFGLG